MGFPLKDLLSSVDMVAVPAVGWGAEPETKDACSRDSGSATSVNHRCCQPSNSCTSFSSHPSAVEQSLQKPEALPDSLLQPKDPELYVLVVGAQ